MLFLPAAALCCLCSALVAMAAELIQEDLTLTRRVGGKVSFSCGNTDQCDFDWVYWYQKKETFRVILDIDRSDGEVDSDYNHPQKADFSAVRKQNGCELQIQNVTLDHSATYYCDCLKLAPHSEKCCLQPVQKPPDEQMSNGVCRDEQVVKPVVSVYPAASRAHLEGKSSLLCLASHMFPPLVRFSWKRRREDGSLEELPPAEGEQLELRESGRTAAILLIDQHPLYTYKYVCSVQHEGGTVEAQTEQEVSALPPKTSPPPSPPPSSPPPPSPPPAASVPSQYQVKLLCVLYTVLIVKSLVYCCGLSLLMILRNKGPSTNCTHAD